MAEEATITDANEAVAPEWVESYDLELDADTVKAVSKYKTIEEALKGHAHLSKKLGSAINLPKDDAPDDEKAKVLSDIYTKLGKPEKPEDYELKAPENLPEGVGWSPELAGAFAQICHKANITKAQAHQLVNFHLQSVVSQVEGMQKGVAEAAEALKQEIGADKFETYLADSNKAVAYADTKVPGLVEFMQSTKVGNANLASHPLMVKLFNELYRKEIAEGISIPSSAGTGDNKTGVFSNDFYKRPTEGKI